ncbi:von Willebrand factor A domain-containing protein 5A [Tolypocladium paradoxum]|uniref:von Willebrand factor A domain-containing protein 5A n=1 Tax=Tolypocladium paradoxum TaxID=94208 RepID=A0A2S4KP15_9HYPO|nr:von Willebrand factor A domain-containing protein 5A [Tolypocladium paradoxum]
MPKFNPSSVSPAPLPFCGCFVIISDQRKWLPMINLDAHVTILSCTSRTTLTQTFVNPHSDSRLDEVHYDFPLYDGVSVVGFTCTVGSRVIRGVVRERQAAQKTFDDAVSRGETAGLLQQSERAADVFTTTLGNVPAGETVKVEITYLGELEHDAEADGVRWTLPTSIAPRYGGHGLVAPRNVAAAGGKISITVDAEMPDRCPISTVQSPSHPISVSIGTTSTASASANEPLSLRRASATLSLGSAELDKDFVVLVVAAGLGSPAALLETHPSGSRALMATLVPRFSLPASKPEVVFVCDRSGSMGVGKKIPNLVAALQIFLKSLPVGARFNICSFGSRHSFLWNRSRLYDQDSLDQAVAHVKTFGADFGGTQMYAPLEDTFKKRYADMNLEVFLLTDGEIWEQEQLFTLINDNVAKTKGAIRVFTLGIGDEASSSLLNGVARAGGGFAQKVAADEKLDKKIIRMLKGALTPHVTDYALEVKYEKPRGADDDDDDFEVVEKVMDALSLDVKDNGQAERPKPESKEPMSLFSPDVRDEDLEMPDSSATIDAKFSKLPTVAHPRYLQTPFTIPALFPFSRTAVYVILSDATPHREPTSVVLTGTSDHGPLRLEIPITKLAGKGATIHQLAARKAIQELEEGRGWIAHAKDAKGKLLKEAYEGRFHLMVQREGVRLGVEYQVGGKWCSFVAVQEDGDKDKELGEFKELRPQAPAAAPAMFSAPAAPRMRMVSMGRAGPVAAASRRSAPQFSPPPPAPTMGSSATLFGGPAPGGPGGPKVSFFGSYIAESAPAPKPSAGSAAPTGWFGGGGRGHGIEKKKRSSPSSPRQEYDCLQAFDCEPDQSMFDTEFADMDEGGLGVAPAAEDARRRNTGSGSGRGNSLAALAALQTFIGSWAWSVELESIISVKQQQTLALRLPKVSGGASRGDVVATLCAVVFLKKRLADERDAWELMVDKAERWLENRTAVPVATLEKMVEAAGLF